MRLPAAVVLLLLAGPALAHEGRYVGPVVEIPPHERRPTDWPPPDMSGSGPTPPAPPRDQGVGPLACGPPPPIERLGFESWRFAWHLQENSIVEARAREFRGDSRTPHESLSARIVEETLLPALRSAAADDHQSSSFIEAGILGLVRNGDVAVLDLLRATALNDGKERRHIRVEETGVLALGFIEGGEPANGPLLLSVAGDPKGRTRSRAWACISLGLLERGRPSLDTLRMLEARLFDEAEGWSSPPGIAASAAFALGRLGTAEASGILRRYLDAPPPPTKWRKEMGADMREPALLCHVAAALGRAAAASGDAGVAEDALASLSRVGGRGAGLPAQGAVIGLGFLGAGASQEVASKCVRILGPLQESESTDGQVCRFATLALARIAARGPAPARNAAFELLTRSLATGRPTRSWAALAAGIAGEGRTAEERAGLARAVRKLWEGPFVPGVAPVEERGGCLVAMGLLRDISARTLLETLVVDQGQDADLRGYAATALGLLGDPDSVPVLRAVLEDKAQRRWYRPVVVALGLLGDAESVEVIVDVLGNPKSSLFVLGGCAQALGFLGDGRAVKPLLAVIDDASYPDLTRAAALHALGRMAAGSRPDPFADLAEDAPYRAYTEALGELWQIL